MQFVAKLVWPMMIWVLSCSFLYAQTVSDMLSQHYSSDISVNWTIDYWFPTWVKANPWNRDLDFWLQTLPYEQDKHGSWYLVYPKYGIIVPLLTPNASDHEKILQWENFNHFPYLQNGALHYFGKDPSEGKGNMVVAAHSSFEKSDIGRYKTIFQVLPISEVWDSILVYLQSPSGYDRYEYEITKSFKTSKSDVSILSQSTNDENILTTYGCYPLWSNTERWVNQSILKSVSRAENLEHSAADMHMWWPNLAKGSDSWSENIDTRKENAIKFKSFQQKLREKRTIQWIDQKLITMIPNTKKRKLMARKILSMYNDILKRKI